MILKAKKSSGIPVLRKNRRIQQGGSIWDDILSAGKTLIANPKVQKTAIELGSEAYRTIMASMKKPQVKPQVKANASTSGRDPRLNALLGKGIKYLA